MRFQYTRKTFHPKSKSIICKANDIIAEYLEKGFRLTLRQLYYQFVARGWISNNQRSYNKLGSIINNARLSGYIDWEAIEDRTRFIRRVSTWDSPKAILDVAAETYRRDLWENQRFRPEVWIEKDALIGVIEPTCNTFRIPCLSCRGYVSQSEMWATGQRFVQHFRNGQEPIIFHLGDHDPSGIDMSRDIEDRVNMFVQGHLPGMVKVKFERLALNKDQIKEHNPPPNPAKMTDTRVHSYLKEHGDTSWELDALPPDVLCGLIDSSIVSIWNWDQWKKDKRKEDRERSKLKKIAKEYK